MLNRLCMLFLTLLCVVTVYGQAGSVQRRNYEADVLTTYSSLAALDMKQQIAMARELPAQMRAALWILQLNSFLIAHADLTDDQRLVVYQVIGFVASGNLEIPHDSLLWQTQGLPMLRRLRLAAESEFPPALAREAFSHMGTLLALAPGAGDSRRVQLHGTIMALHPIPTDMPDCNCHGGNYFWTTCPFGPTDPSKCHAEGGVYRCLLHVDGCGFLWEEACDGLCV